MLIMIAIFNCDHFGVVNASHPAFGRGLGQPSLPIVYGSGIPRCTGKLPIEPSASVARLLLKRQGELGLSLRRVQERTQEMGQFFPFTTIGKIEQGRIERGFKRLHLLFKVYDLPSQLAHELVQLEEFAGEPCAVLPPATLYEEGTKHWKAGNFREGMAYLLAVRNRNVNTAAARLERQQAILTFAVEAGSVGRNRLSKHIVDELLLEPPETELFVPGLIQAAVCWRRLGSKKAALGFLSRAAELTAPVDHRDRAWIHHPAQAHSPAWAYSERLK
jgi:hypothetical protein